MSHVASGGRLSVRAQLCPHRKAKEAELAEVQAKLQAPSAPMCCAVLVPSAAQCCVGKDLESKLEEARSEAEEASLRICGHKHRCGACGSSDSGLD